MSRRSLVVAMLAALALGLSLFAAACGGGGGGEKKGGGETTGKVTKGGIYRGASSNFEFTGAFDPTGEYLGDAWGVYSNMLIRTLVNYKHVAGPEGNVLVPDLATSVPTPTDGGKTYTFHLKSGIKFGPPVNREITSKDIAYAFERMASKPLVAQYGFYYDGVIEGFKTHDGPPTPISGIDTPDNKTIVFHLTKPTGDFLNRVGMPATGPIPREVAKCFTKAGEYGRYVISSGPYMIKGSDQLNISSCGTMKPISGFQPTRQLSLVRNPQYDQSTDQYRKNYIDGFTWTLNTNVKDYFNRIKNGQLETSLGSEVPSEVVREYVTNSNLKDRLRRESGDRTWYIYLNITQPPFDDIHVRKAANLIMDKDGLLRAWGGPTRGTISTHIVPNLMFSNDLKDYDPYATPGHAGDLAKAQAEMKKSKYDTNKDGKCDASVCKGLLHITRNTPPWTDMVPVIENSLGKIGITLTTRELKDQYPIIQTVSKNVPIGSGAGWGKDYADASTFFVLLDSAGILATGNSNYALVGLTPQKAREVGAKGSINNVPSIDADIDRCNTLKGDPRLKCWEDLDKKTMEQVVPWIPYLDSLNINVIGPAVTKYEYDQFSGTTAYSQVALDVSKQK